MKVAENPFPLSSNASAADYLLEYNFINAFKNNVISVYLKNDVISRINYSNNNLRKQLHQCSRLCSRSFLRSMHLKNDVISVKLSNDVISRMNCININLRKQLHQCSRVSSRLFLRSMHLKMT